jgi:hypothetical protein
MGTQETAGSSAVRIRRRSAGQKGLLRREGEYWTIEYDGLLVRTRDSKGVRYLSAILGRPGEVVSALELEGATDRSPVATERARLNVTRRIRAARERIALIHPSLGAHLEATVRTGKSCCYRPDPRVPIRWQV